MFESTCLPESTISFRIITTHGVGIGAIVLISPIIETVSRIVREQWRRVFFLNYLNALMMNPRWPVLYHDQEHQRTPETVTHNNRPTLPVSMLCCKMQHRCHGAGRFAIFGTNPCRDDVRFSERIILGQAAVFDSVTSQLMHGLRLPCLSLETDVQGGRGRCASGPSNLAAEESDSAEPNTGSGMSVFSSLPAKKMISDRTIVCV